MLGANPTELPDSVYSLLKSAEQNSGNNPFSLPKDEQTNYIYNKRGNEIALRGGQPMANYLVVTRVLTSTDDSTIQDNLPPSLKDLAVYSNNKYNRNDYAVQYQTETTESGNILVHYYTMIDIADLTQVFKTDHPSLKAMGDYRANESEVTPMSRPPISKKMRDSSHCLS